MIVPDNEVKIITNIEVATDTWKERFRIEEYIGTFTTPPPTPSKPDNNPLAKRKGEDLIKSERGKEYDLVGLEEVFFAERPLTKVLKPVNKRKNPKINDRDEEEIKETI